MEIGNFLNLCFHNKAMETFGCYNMADNIDLSNYND